jgi:ribonuclease VapC
MVVDTSALIAILFDEGEKAAFASAIDTAADPKISAVTRMETAMVCLGRSKSELNDVLDLIDILGLKTIEIDRAQADRALDAFVRFGKGRHPARLNLGDCFAYALAATLNEPLLFKGGDFLKTDIVPAWRPSEDRGDA